MIIHLLFSSSSYPVDNTLLKLCKFSLLCVFFVYLYSMANIESYKLHLDYIYFFGWTDNNLMFFFTKNFDQHHQDRWALEWLANFGFIFCVGNFLKSQYYKNGHFAAFVKSMEWYWVILWALASAKIRCDVIIIIVIIVKIIIIIVIINGSDHRG